MIKNGLIYFGITVLCCHAIVRGTTTPVVTAQLMATMRSATTPSPSGLQNNAGASYLTTNEIYLKTLSAPAGYYFPVPYPVANEPIIAAQSLMAENRAAFGISSSDVDLVVQRASQTNAFDYVRFKQTYLDLPVFGAEVIVQMNVSGVVYVPSDVMRNTSRLDKGVVSILPTIYAADGGQLALDQAMATYPGKSLIDTDASDMVMVLMLQVSLVAIIQLIKAWHPVQIW